MHTMNERAKNTRSAIRSSSRRSTLHGRWRVTVVVVAILTLTTTSEGQEPSSFGGLIGVSTVVPCVNIDLDPDKAPTLECNNATVLIFSLTPGTSGGGITYVFENQNEAVQGPGANFNFGRGAVDENDCLQDSPNVCRAALSDQQIRITLNITKPLGSYPLDWTGINGPFLYVYRNCINPISQPQTDDMTDKCGQRYTSTNIKNYAKCPAPGNEENPDGLYFGYDDDGPYYTECAADCFKNIEYILRTEGKRCDDTRHHVVEDYINGEIGTQNQKFLLPDGTEFDPQDVFEDFPVPTLMCPCEMTQTKVGNYFAAPNYSCRSGSCAGSCGSAIPCTDETSTGVCVNTDQLHRCIKCQPDQEPPRGPACIYPDIDARLYCNNEGFSSFCPNGGDSVVGPGTIGQTDSIPFITDFTPERDFIARQCNCDAYWVDRAYWTSPICAAYRINQPEQPVYTVTATIENLGTGEVSTLAVGQGLAPDGEPLPRSEGNEDVYLALISDDKPAGNLFTEIHGSIVMCDGIRVPPANGSESVRSCSNVPGAGIKVSPTADGRTNPWTQFPDNGAGKVPLPEYVTFNATERARTNAPWWYYLGPQRIGQISRTCNGWGWAPNGLADTQGANILCGGLQGTCVPGYDQVTGGDTTVTPSFVAHEWAEYITRNAGKADAGDGVSEVPRFMPPGWTQTTPNMWVDRGQLMIEDPTLLDFLNVRVLVAVNAELVEEWTTVGGGHLEPFVEDVESTGERRNCLLQPQFGYGTAWAKIVNDGSQTAVYTLTTNCSTGIEAISQDAEYSVPPGQSAGLPVALNLAVTTAVFLDPSAAECTTTLRPVGFPNRVLDTAAIPCTFSVLFTSIGPIGSGLFANTTAGGLIQNLTGPQSTDFCIMFPTWCDLLGFDTGSSTLFQTIIMLLALVGVLIAIAYCTSKCGQLLISESALSLQRAKQYRSFERNFVPQARLLEGTPEEQAAKAQRIFDQRVSLLEQMQANAVTAEVGAAFSELTPTSLAGMTSGDTATQLVAKYAPAVLEGAGAAVGAGTAAPREGYDKGSQKYDDWRQRRDEEGTSTAISTRADVDQGDDKVRVEAPEGATKKVTTTSTVTMTNTNLEE